MKHNMAAFLCVASNMVLAQDTTMAIYKRVYTMPTAIVRSNIDVPQLIRMVQQDTTFYKAFKNLKVLSYTAINDIEMHNKHSTPIATLHSTTKQVRTGNCRVTQVVQEAITGNFYTKQKAYNYYTAELYAALFWVPTQQCNETNIIGNTDLQVQGKSGTERHKQQLKNLFFNPGSKVQGIPLMGNKAALYSTDLSAYYNSTIDYETYLGTSCYKFTTQAKPNLTKAQRSNIVIDEMISWFSTNTLAIIGRTYTLSYSAGVYDFKVSMQVDMGTYNGLTVPKLIRYVGNWDVAFKKRERGIFTAILYDFK